MADELPTGQVLHWYTIERVLGQGGFGITYLARDTNLDQSVAIKEYLPREIAGRAGDLSVRPRSQAQLEQFRWGLDRFLSEARILARFDHANIARVRAVFEANHTAYMVMRYEQGRPLNEILDRRGHLPQEDLLRIVLPVLDGLERVHEAGFIHRDIQPANIFIRDDGSPVLLDFGAARPTMGRAHTVTILVAPGYAPIEQYYASSQEQGPWTDIYGLGATLYRAVAGIAPIDALERGRGIPGSSKDMLVPATVIGQGRYTEPFLRAIDHALKFSEKERPQTLREWAGELQAEVIETRPQPTPVRRFTTGRPDPQPSASLAGRLRSMARGGIIATVFLAGIAIGMVLWYGRSAQDGDDARAPAAEPPPTGASERARADAALPSGTDPALETSDAAGAFDHPGTQPGVLPRGEAEVPVVLAGAAQPAAAFAQPDQVDAEASRLDSLRRELNELEARRDRERERLAKLEVESKRLLALREEINALEARRAAERQRLEELARQRRGTQDELRAGQGSGETAAQARGGEADGSKAIPVSAAPSALGGEADAPTQPRPVATAKAGRQAPESTPVSDPLAEGLAALEAKDYGTAFAILRPLADGGDARARYQLAELYGQGRGVVQNPRLALDLTRRAAFQGLTDAQAALARMYSQGIDGRRDPFLAYTWYLVATANGAAEHIGDLASMHEELQVEQSYQAQALAVHLRERARLAPAED